MKDVTRSVQETGVKSGACICAYSMVFVFITLCCVIVGPWAFSVLKLLAR